MVLVAVLSSIPGTDDSGFNFLGLIPPTLQNLLHVPLFALLAWSWHRSLRRIGWRLPIAVTIAAAISLVWAVLDEWHQLYVPGRYATLTDLLLDFVGVGLGLAIAIWLASGQKTSV